MFKSWLLWQIQKLYRAWATDHKSKHYTIIIPCCLLTFFIGDFFTERLDRGLLEDAWPAFLAMLPLPLPTTTVVRALLTATAARALVLEIFLTAWRWRPRPRPASRPASASSSLLLGESTLPGEAFRPDLVCIAKKTNNSYRWEADDKEKYITGMDYKQWRR